MNRVEQLFDWAFSQPNKPAVVTQGHSYSFEDVANGLQQAAKRLSLYAGRGSKVGLYLHNTPNFILYEYGTFFLGGMVSPINRLLTPHEVEPIVDRLGLDLVVSDEDLDLGPVPVVRVEGEWDVPEELPSSSYEPMTPDDPVFVLQTSGTTGTPKGVMLNYWNLVRNYDPSYRWIGVTGSDTILQALPLYNTYGLNQGINMMAMTGATMRLFPRFSMDDIVEATETYESIFFPTVPTMISRFREAGHVIRRGKLKVGIGAAPVARAIAEDAWAVFPEAYIYLGYGLTEATAIVALNHIGVQEQREAANLDSVGKPVTGVTVQIDKSSETEEMGEILVAGDCVFPSYVGTDAQRPVEGEWLNTGDMGKMKDKWLYIVDRKRDLIIRGGQNIYPGEVERALYDNSSVLEAAVIGKPHRDLGEVPVAFITLQPEAEVTAAELQDFCRERLARFKIPEEFFTVSELPKGPTGKISKVDLSRQLDSV